MAEPVAERISWAVAQLQLRPGQRVLEAGCGHGVAVSVMCAEYGAAVLALDRSATMIAAARRRNAEFVARGQAEFMQAELAAADLGERIFDRVLAIHLPVLLRGEPARELAAVAAHLAVDGEVHVSSQPPGQAHADAELARVSEALHANGFRVARVAAAVLAGRRTFSVVGVRGAHDGG